MVGSEYADRLGKMCLDKFNDLPRSCKPNKTEWTVLACVVLSNNGVPIKVVALGTGTKCIGADQLCPNGWILNDSHAEVVARRCFLRYLYSQMSDKESDIFERHCNHLTGEKRDTFKIKSSITFEFFSTHLPCGDASIVLDENTSDEPIPKRIKLFPDQCKRNNNKPLDNNFTGAKLINPDSEDLMAQDECALRTKPGRGVRTLSMSCSDKLSRWNVMGVQGALLSLLLTSPIYFNNYTFCGKFSEISVRRAIWDRWDTTLFSNPTYKFQKPMLHLCSEHIQFEFCQSCEKHPSPNSIAWCDIPNRPLEVCVSGKRQGVTKKNRNTEMGCLTICRAALFNQFVGLLKNSKYLCKYVLADVEDNNELDKVSYGLCKRLAIKYQDAWLTVKKDVFRGWTQKPQKLLDFRVT